MTGNTFITITEKMIFINKYRVAYYQRVDKPIDTLADCEKGS